MFLGDIFSSVAALQLAAKLHEILWPPYWARSWSTMFGAKQSIEPIFPLAHLSLTFNFLNQAIFGLSTCGGPGARDLGLFSVLGASTF